MEAAFAQGTDAGLRRANPLRYRARPMDFLRRRLAADTRSRRILLGLVLYLVCGGVFALVAGPPRLSEHTAYNHYALLADAWLHGRQDLPGGPPRYTGNNDFASFNGKTYISFPPFPAVLMLPLVKVARSPEDFRDGQFLIWLAGLGPALLFLVLEKLRRTARSPRSELENLMLALLFAFGTVYFFTAVEGTVWFAAHVVAAALVCGYLLTALDAEHPVLAGALLGCSFATRPVTALFAVFFALEAVRASARRESDETSKEIDGPQTILARARALWPKVDRGQVLRRWALFAAPILVILGICSWSNHSRFGSYSPNAFGHEYLSVAWHDRMQKWGLFGYHYLAKNLACALTLLPWLPAHNAPAQLFSTHGPAPFQINEHGLALWFTTPIYLWLLRPRERGFLHDTTILAIVGPAIMLLLYQNTGWRQFGYRFSNDYAPLLFVLLAIGKRPFGWLFRTAAVWGVVVNLFGAITFDRSDGRMDRYYFRDGSQVTVYQPD